MINETTFWTIIGFIVMGIGGLFLMQYKTSAVVAEMGRSIVNLTKTIESFMVDRHEKDKAYYEWRDGMNRLQTQHDMMTRGKNIIARHNEESP